MKIKLSEEASKIMEQGSMLDTVVGGIKDFGRTTYDVVKNRHQYGRELLGTTEKSLQSQATDAVKNVYNAAKANTTSQQNNMIALCSDLGVKSPGYCDTRGKKPIKSCAEMGIKTPGYCYVDTKQLVPGIKQSTNTIKEQGTTPTPKVDPQKLNYVISAWGGPNAVTVNQTNVGTTVTNNKTKSSVMFDLKTGMVSYDKTAAVDPQPYSMGAPFDGFKKWFDSNNNFNPLSGLTSRSYIDEKSIDDSMLSEQISRIKTVMGLNEQHDDMETPQEDVPQVGDNELAQKAQDAVQQLSPEEQEILSNFIQNNPQGFINTVKKEVSQEKQEEMSDEMSEEDEMSDSEFEARRILHKIINYVGVGSMIAVVPAAMFIGGGVAAALGVTALAGSMFKDAAFFKRGGKYRDHHYDAQDKAERMNEGVKQLSRIKTVMGLTNGNINENKRLDEDFVDNVTSAVKSGFNTVKGGIQNVVGGVQKGMNTVASGMVNTLTSDADLKKFNNRILAIANVIKYAKKGTDPKTQQPAWTIINPLSKANGMRLDEYFKTYRVSVGEVEAAKLVNQQGGKPLNATQRVNASSGQYYRSYAAHPPTFAKLFK